MTAQIDGRAFLPKLELKLKESPAAPGIYFLYVKTDMGLQQQYGSNGAPLSIDAFDFKSREPAHTFTETYQTLYRSALQNDPNGAQYGNTSWMDAFGEMLGLVDSEVTYGPSQATIDAERALIFSRSRGDASSNCTTSLFSEDFLATVYISLGNSAVSSTAPDGLSPTKLSLGKNLASVLFLVKIAPIKSLPGVT